MGCKNKIFNKLKRFFEYIFNCDNSNITSNIPDKDVYEIEINDTKYYLIGKESIKI